MSHPSHPYIFADIDESHCLNGHSRGGQSSSSYLKKTYSRPNNKKQSRCKQVSQHFVYHSKAYFVLLVVLLVVGGVYYIEQVYQGEQGKILTELVHERDNPQPRNKLPKQQNSKQPLNQKIAEGQAATLAHSIPSHSFEKTQTTAEKVPSPTSRKPSGQALAPKPDPQPKIQAKTNKKQQPQPVMPKNGPPPQPQSSKPKEMQAQIVEKMKQRSQQTGGNKRPIANIGSDQRDNAAAFMALKDEDFTSNSSLAQKERQYYEKKYNISKYEELPICVVIPSYNNVKDKRHIKNIRSVLMQEYTNYHIVFIDDASTDGTGDQIDQYLRNNQTVLPPEKYIVIKNQEQKRAMPNLRMAAMDHCKPQDIYIIADGDDQLLGKQVFKLFNAIFQKEGSWFVYTNFLNIRGSIGYSRPFPAATIKNNKYRTYPFVTSHLRAFYTQLFRNIKDVDLRDEQGNYLKAANDVAICIPILEMAHERVIYVPELTYYYNSNTGQNNHQVRLKQQKSNDRMLRKRKPYTALQYLMQPAPWLQEQNSTSLPNPFTETKRNLGSN